MYAKLLHQVRDSLTTENWHKGSYFSQKENKLCMCVHGAAQTLVNPQVKIAISEKGSIHTVCKLASYASRSFDEFTMSFITAHLSKSNSLHDTWKYRNQYSKYINEDYIYDNVNYGNTNLYWLMGMFGITAGFNDDPETTLEMVKEKLILAAKWAEENEEFLLNN